MGELEWDVYIEGRGAPSDIKAKVRQTLTGLQYDTQFMLLLFINDIEELHKRGWDLPLGLSLSELRRIKNKYTYRYPIPY